MEQDTRDSSPAVAAADEAKQIRANRRAYRRLAREMARDEAEYFNPPEQRRLSEALDRALGAIASKRDGRLSALDAGCGGGHLTRYLLERGCDVTAADVSPDLLRIVEARYGGSGRLTTMPLDGRTLEPVATGSMDFVATYSVLHHVPDYLAFVDEMCRVLRPGGVVMIDHELSPRYWGDDGSYRELQEAVKRHTLEAHWWTPAHRRWQRMLLPQTWITRVHLMRDPRWQPGGDIHVWPDDHVDWTATQKCIEDARCELLLTEDYLAFRGEYTSELYERYRNSTADMRILIGRKRPLEQPSVV
jgi:SAM-dependent methyltransferase